MTTSLLSFLLGVSLLATPAPHWVVHEDARHDVLHFDVGSESSTPAPRERATDITRTVVDHRTDRLVVRARARHLVRTDHRLLVGEVMTSQGQRFTLVVDYSTQPIDSRVSLQRFSSGREVRCPGTSWSVSRRTDEVAASVPRSCLDQPRWVRVGLALSAAPRSLRSSWTDDSRTHGRVGDQHLRLGPRQTSRGVSRG